MTSRDRLAVMLDKRIAAILDDQPDNSSYVRAAARARVRANGRPRLSMLGERRPDEELESAGLFVGKVDWTALTHEAAHNIETPPGIWRPYDRPQDFGHSAFKQFIGKGKCVDCDRK